MSHVSNAKKNTLALIFIIFTRNNRTMEKKMCSYLHYNKEEKLTQLDSSVSELEIDIIFVEKDVWKIKCHHLAYKLNLG